MTVFDGTGAPAADWKHEAFETPPPPVNALDLLRTRVKEAEDLQFDPTVIEVPGDVGIRLICTSDIEGNTLTRWQRGALPSNKRNSPKISPLMMDQTHYSTTVLIETCTEVQVRGGDGEWTTIVNSDGDVLTFKDKALLDVLGSVDPRAAVKKLFAGREASVARAAQEVLTGAGWGEDGDDEDPR